MAASIPAQHAATAGWRKEKPPSRQLSGLQTREGGGTEKEVAKDTQDHNGKSVLFQPHHSRRVLLSGAPRQDRGTAASSDTSGGSGRSRHNRPQVPVASPQHEQQTTGLSVRAPNANCPATMEPRYLRPHPNTNSRQQFSQFGP
jgi:hypothetical protein